MATFVQSRDENYALPFVRNMRRVPKQDRTRSRKLDDAELQAVWRHAEGAGAYGALIQLLLLTAQRYDKVLDLQWGDISDGVWTVRTEQARRVTSARRSCPMSRCGSSTPSRASPATRSSSPVAMAARVFSTSDKRAFDQACGITGWRLHDLRRTAKSLMSRARVLREHSERVLGHAIGGVEGVYDRHEYFDEKSEALRKLAALIEMIVHPPADNVVPLHEAVRS